MDGHFSAGLRIGSRLPKLAPDTICRERISRWLTDHADFPLRLLAAPAGSGKTTALVLYAAAARRRVVYAAVDLDTTADGLVTTLAKGLGVDAVSPTLAAFLDRLVAIGRSEILVDGVDRSSPAVQAVLQRLVTEAPENVTFAYASRSRDVLDTNRLVTIGLAALLTADRLAFTLDEAACFVEAARALVVDERDIARVLNDTDGWAFALCSAVRHAVSTGRTLDTAVENWQRVQARFIKRFLDDALAGEEPALAADARRMLDGERLDDEILDRLEARGLFVRWSDDGFRPHRVLSRLAPSAARPASSPVAVAVTLFGGAEARLNGHKVEWIRRRDAHLFAFIAMQPNGRATRRAILEAFWPGGDRSLASQSLRSACSTLRRAFAGVVGFGALASYLSFGDEIALNLDLFTIDARRVRSHLVDADAARVRGDDAVAREHTDAARRLAREPFLGGDVPAALREIARTLDDGVAAIERPFVPDLSAAI